MSESNNTSDTKPSKSLYRLALELTLEAPVLTQSVNARAIGVDTAMQFYNDMPALSGSLIAGNIRHTLDEFLQLFEGRKANSQTAKTSGAKEQHFLTLKTLIKNGFGTESMTSHLLPERRQIQFDNYWLLSEIDGNIAKPQDIQHEIQTRIEINPETGTVNKGALNVIETLFKSGTELTFRGGISLLLDSPKTDNKEQRQVDHDKQQRALVDWFNKALSYLTALGANKGVGFGRIKRFTLTPQAQGIHFDDLVKASSDSQIPQRVRLKLVPKEPFCIAKPHTPNSNRFEAEDIISGGVIRGCLARLLGKEQLRTVDFSRWIVSHGKPISAEKAIEDQDVTRMLPLPLSLAHLGHQKDQPSCHLFADLVHHAAGRVTIADTGKKVIPDFSSDWKYSVRELVNKKWGVATTHERLLRVQTALNSRFADKAAMQATDEQLFSMELIHPKEDIWLCEIDLSQLDKEPRKLAYGLLTNLADLELIGLGKTDSRFSLSLFDTKDHSPSEPLEQKNQYRIQLVTDARLLTHQQASKIPNVMGTEALTAAYEKYWLEESNQSLQLNTHFSRQRLVGGNYYHQRFLSGKDYQPVWLCEAGSVFDLTPVAGKEKQAAEIIAQWCRLGLPQPDDATNWENNPWVRENGFGEIVVNRTDIMPSKQYALAVKKQSQEQHNV